jgi:hypothetical protein
MSSSISTVLNFEEHYLTFMEHGSKEIIIRLRDLAAPMETTERNVRQKAAVLTDSERVEVELPTFGGTQKVLFVTRSGALQILATGRSEKCRRLRKVICDFFVEWMDGKHRDAPDLRPVMEEVTRLGRSVAELALAVAQLNKPSLQPVVYGSKRYRIEDLNVLTPQAEIRLFREGYRQSSEFLIEVTGSTEKFGPVAGSLTRRAISLCRRRGWDVQRYLKSGRVLTFFPKMALLSLWEGREVGQLLLLEGGRSQVAPVEAPRQSPLAPEASDPVGQAADHDELPHAAEPVAR